MATNVAKLSWFGMNRERLKNEVQFIKTKL
nr:MAG TPA: hypothetical protein [Caudoviricetes sp.]DAU10427.1 MAG TPA: hypothetical protein [Caudoviricetes sp.]